MSGVVAVGLDVGGTNLRAVLLAADGKIRRRWTTTLPERPSAETLIDLAARAVRAVSKEGPRPLGVGIGMAALLSPRGLPLPGLSNQPALVGVDVARLLARCVGLPCEIENDARAAIRGEAALGAARGHDNALCLTIGSGIGGGLLIGGRVHAGGRDRSGELGLWRIVARSDGTAAWTRLEEVAAPGGVLRRTGRRLEDHLRAAAEGDRDSAALVAEVYDLLGAALANAQLLLDLDVAILTGGFSEWGEPMRRGIERAHRGHVPECYRDLEIVLAALGPWSGAVGAARLVYDRRDPASR